MKLSIKYRIFLFLLTMGMAGCLKDNDYEDGLIQSVQGGSANMVEIKITASSASNFGILSFDNTSQDTTINLIPVNVSTAGPVGEDVSVTLVQKNSLVEDYNDENGTDYQVPTAAMITILNPGNVVTIPKGSNTGYLQARFKPSDFIVGTWALGYEISAVDKTGLNISGNLKTGIVAILVKNEYDGEYDVEGYFQHPTAPRDIHQEEHLTTVGPKTVAKGLGDLPDTYVNLTINADNTVSIAPGKGTSGTTASVAAMPASGIYNNTYDPATRTFYLHYGYPQPGPTRIITETVVRQ